jgi:hypothetical protein
LKTFSYALNQVLQQSYKPHVVFIVFSLAKCIFWFTGLKALRQCRGGVQPQTAKDISRFTGLKGISNPSLNYALEVGQDYFLAHGTKRMELLNNNS